MPAVQRCIFSVSSADRQDSTRKLVTFASHPERRQNLLCAIELIYLENRNLNTSIQTCGTGKSVSAKHSVPKPNQMFWCVEQQFSGCFVLSCERMPGPGCVGSELCCYNCIIGSCEPSQVVRVNNLLARVFCDIKIEDQITVVCSVTTIQNVLRRVCYVINAQVGSMFQISVRLPPAGVFFNRFDCLPVKTFCSPTKNEVSI